ncbi:DinB family protein [Pedobacter sp. L105]|uniref:DinB family protein n=1 Tax=Pedobacter sp. L105 TaxID=1641871 RepID=UPI00131E997A|nr:DinB family protein [Pedobacter sp. L105]
MIKDILNNISLLCDSFPDQLRTITADQFCTKPLNKWSKKEILGHLVDSANVNIQRFIRGQIEDNPSIYYEQDEWVSVQGYQEYDDEKLITLWESLNRHLAYLVNRIPDTDLSRTCLMKNGEPRSLQYLVEDYLSHLQHHIRQITA